MTKILTSEYVKEKIKKKIRSRVYTVKANAGMPKACSKHKFFFKLATSKSSGILYSTVLLPF